MSEKDVKKREDGSTPQAALTTVAEMKKAIEAILFAAGYPMSYEKLSSLGGFNIYCRITFLFV